MSLQLERLCQAIAEQEGWLSSIDEPRTKGSRSWRNHNPGNLRRSPFSIGVEDGFCVFKTDQDGMSALSWDIRQKATGNTTTGLTGSSTLADLINIWAPKSDGNNTDIYLQSVVKNSGIDKNTLLRDIIK